MKQSLRGKTAIITGGSTELAAAVSLELARAGVQIHLCGRQADMLDMAANAIKADGGICLTTVSEIESLENAEQIVQATREHFGAIDILALISPFWSGGLIHNHNVKSWDLVINANLREPFLMARSILPLFRNQGHGEIMAIGSDSGMGVFQQDGAYAVAMHGLKTLMELIHLENSEHGIRTHTLMPGLALSTPFDAEGNPNLTTNDVSEWVVWLLTRPDHLRGNGPILV
jgi:NAD(P)-dependent dehydrogenase (short-subunit alcohol dehydrogenase family)